MCLRSQKSKKDYCLKLCEECPSHVRASIDNFPKNVTKFAPETCLQSTDWHNVSHKKCDSWYATKARLLFAQRR